MRGMTQRPMPTGTAPSAWAPGRGPAPLAPTVPTSALAHSDRRMLATAIDLLIGTLILATISVLLALVTDSAGSTAETQGFAVGIGTIVAGLAYLGWLIRSMARDGQTFGKRIADVRVVTERGEPVDGAQAAIRYILLPVDIGVFLVGLWMIVFKRRKQRLGDLAAKTLVVRE